VATRQILRAKLAITVPPGTYNVVLPARWITPRAGKKRLTRYGGKKDFFFLLETDHVNFNVIFHSRRIKSFVIKTVVLIRAGVEKIGADPALMPMHNTF